MKKRWRFAWPCVSALALCGVACTTQRAADTVKVPRSAQEILSRPDRAHEERQAWYPARTESLDALQAPADGVGPSQPNSRAVRTPAWRVLGPVQWMDNRYAMIGVQTEGSDAQGEVQGVVSILDTATAELFPYKPGRFICYHLGKIIFETGPLLAFIRPDLAGAQMWIGDVLQERPHAAWFGSDTKDMRRYMPLRDTCAGVMDPQAWVQLDKDIGGVFFPEPRREETPVWKRVGLLSEHGFFANHLPTVQKIPYGNEMDAYAQIHWFRPGKDKVVLPLSLMHEVGQAGISEWSPWLGRYVLSGSGMRYSQATGSIRSEFTESALRYGRAGNVVIFDPRDGDIRKIPRPPELTTVVQLRKAFATRGGMLWQSATRKPWGLYLSRGATVRRIADVRAERIAISPDGCRAVVLSHQNPKAEGGVNKLDILNFCNGAN